MVYPEFRSSLTGTGKTVSVPDNPPMDEAQDFNLGGDAENG
jgi:hypothetical protein